MVRTFRISGCTRKAEISEIRVLSLIDLSVRKARLNVFRISDFMGSVAVVVFLPEHRRKACYLDKKQIFQTAQSILKAKVQITNQ